MISLSRVSTLCFSSPEPHPFSLSYSFGLYTSACHRSLHFLPYFFNLPEIVFFLDRDRLCHRPRFFPNSFPPVYSLHPSLVYFNFLRGPFAFHIYRFYSNHILSANALHLRSHVEISVLQLYIFPNSIHIVQFESFVISLPCPITVQTCYFSRTPFSDLVLIYLS